MTIILPQSTDGETISAAAGTHVGTVRFSKHDVTFQGAGIDATIVKADGHDARGWHAPALIDGAPCRKVTIRDLTIDCDRLPQASLVAAVLCSHTAGNTLGPLELVMERVKITNHHRSTIGILTGRYASLTDVEIVGNGGGVTVGSTTQAGLGCRIRGLTVTGANWSAQVSEVTGGLVGVIPGFDVDDATIVNDYWANPIVGETMTPVAFGAQYVDVSSHVEADRTIADVLRVLTPTGTHEVGTTLTGASKWDRLEMDDGKWTQVLSVSAAGVATLDTWRDAGYWTPVSEPSGTATIYSVTLGRLTSWTSTRLSLVTVSGTPTDAHWRTVEDDDAGTPTIVAGSRLDIMRFKSGSRDVNIQPIHATKACRSARIKNVTIRGSYSDSFSIRGTDGYLEDCEASLGQDMGFTVDIREGHHVLTRCVSRRTGVAGFTVFGDKGAFLDTCEAYDSGYYSSTSAGYGFRGTSDATNVLIRRADGARNRVGLFNEYLTEEDTPPPKSRDRSKYRARFASNWGGQPWRTWRRN